MWTARETCVGIASTTPGDERTSHDEARVRLARSRQRWWSRVSPTFYTSCGKIVSHPTCSERSPARGNRRNLTHLCNLLSSKAQYVRTTSRRGFRSGEAMSSRADIRLFVPTSRNRPRGEDQRSSHHVRCVRRPIDGETRCQRHHRQVN